jgi:protein ImuB
MKKKFAVLFVPEFRLQATLRHYPRERRQPAALLDASGLKPRVVEMNAYARASQVCLGQTPTQALARCAKLNFFSANAGHERSVQEMLLQVAETLSPFIEATSPGVITAELPGERTIGEAEFVSKWVNPLLSAHIEAQVGVGATPDVALLAARFAEPVRVVESGAAFLAPLPVESLEPPGELGRVLESWGIRTIGQLVALPMAEVCERLGPEAVGLWERAHGGRLRPLLLVKPQDYFAEQAELEHPIELLDPLLFLLRRFLDHIMARLEMVYLVAGKLRLVLRFEQGEPYHRVFTIPQPTRDVGLLFRMLHTHLEGFTSDWPIIAVELAAKPVRPDAEQFSLWEGGLRDPHRFAETLARLQALLGTDQVGSPELESSHHPDSFHLNSFDSLNSLKIVETELIQEKELILGVPWLRFRPPVPAQIILDEIRPAFLYSARSTGPIKDARGPWLLEGNWWERAWAREDWDIVTEDGIYRLVHAEESWFLDGVYA